MPSPPAPIVLHPAIQKRPKDADRKRRRLSDAGDEGSGRGTSPLREAASNEGGLELEKKSSCDWEIVPFEVAIMIYEELDVSDLVQMADTCKGVSTQMRSKPMEPVWNRAVLRYSQERKTKLPTKPTHLTSEEWARVVVCVSCQVCRTRAGVSVFCISGDAYCSRCLEISVLDQAKAIEWMKVKNVDKKIRKVMLGWCATKPLCEYGLYPTPQFDELFEEHVFSLAIAKSVFSDWRAVRDDRVESEAFLRRQDEAAVNRQKVASKQKLWRYLDDGISPEECKRRCRLGQDHSRQYMTLRGGWTLSVWNFFLRSRNGKAWMQLTRNGLDISDHTLPYIAQVLKPYQAGARLEWIAASAKVREPQIVSRITELSENYFSTHWPGYPWLPAELPIQAILEIPKLDVVWPDEDARVVTDPMWARMRGTIVTFIEDWVA